MVPGTNRDTLVVEDGAEVMRMNIIDEERLYAGLVCRRANQPHAVNIAELLHHIFEQLRFVPGDIVHSDRQQVIDGRAEPDHA